MSDTHLEPESALTPKERDMHRALISLIEEAEAIDWYNERIAVASDGQLRRILSHNADEEKEHMVMLLEWIRRRDSAFDETLRTYLFTTQDIVEVEAESEGRSTSTDKKDGSEIAGNRSHWTVGSLKSRTS